MNQYHFDNYIERKNTGCIKFDHAAKWGRAEDDLSLWVADMDFETVPEVKEAIAKRALHGIYGYTLPDDSYYRAVIEWMLQQHQYKIEKEWIVITPGVVYALSMAIQAFTKEGEGVMLQRPVYYPFSNMIISNKRKLVNSPLLTVKTPIGFHYEMNFSDFEEKIVKEKVRLFLLCNPHNPGGRVWTKEELKKIAEICIRHNVIVISDEIHSDLTFFGNQHTAFASLSDEVSMRTITCTSPTKTFNLAGLQISNIICENSKLRALLKEQIDRTGYDEPNVFGIEACKAAYQYGEAWLLEAKQYIEENMIYVRKFLQDRLPKIKMMDPEGTYLIWLDFSKLHLKDQELERLVVQKAKLWLDAGTMFGQEGSGFERINVACSRMYLTKAMEALYCAFGSLM